MVVGSVGPEPQWRRRDKHALDERPPFPQCHFVFVRRLILAAAQTLHGWRGAGMLPVKKVGALKRAQNAYAITGVHDRARRAKFSERVLQPSLR
jgi:hypothetical protein